MAARAKSQSCHQGSETERCSLIFRGREEKKQHGILVLDEVEKTADRKFVARLERYFTKTTTGRYRSHWVVPPPFFVSSDMTLQGKRQTDPRLKITS